MEFAVIKAGKMNLLRSGIRDATSQWRCDCSSYHTTHLVILFLLEQSQFTRLFPFVLSCSLRMSSETDLSVNVLGAHPCYPTFDSECPDTWFLQLQTMFELREKRLHHLFSQFELGDRNPSQLLHYMHFLASGYGLHDEILRELWVNYFPVNMVPFLITSPCQDDLDKLAEVAFTIDNVISKLNSSGPEVSIILRAKSNRFTNYYTFSSSVNTIKRQNLDMFESIEPNCQKSSTIFNPMKEFDTKMFQTDIGELSNELLDLADVSSPIHGDIHKLLADN
nr:gag pol polyprotein [Hymenolepis microstoma]